MRQRAPIVLSCAAIAVAVLGATPIGHAAGERLAAVVPFAKTAGNAQKLNGHRSSVAGAPGTIPVVGKNGKLPAAVGAVGPPGPPGPTSGPAGGALAGTYPDPQIAANAIGGAQVADDSLTGADIDEAALQVVPSALVAIRCPAGRSNSPQRT